jgi:hypothetical protein
MRFIRQKLLNRDVGTTTGVRFAAFSFHQAIRAGDIEKERCPPAREHQHSPGKLVDFPLRPSAKAKAEKVMQFPGVHGHYEPCLPSMGQKIPCIFPGDTLFYEIPVGGMVRRHEIRVSSFQLRIGLY